MRNYIIKRLLLAVPTVFIITVLVFSLIRLIPGDVAQLMYEEMAYADSIEELQEQLGLNKPIHTQYFEWVGGLFRGDFGRSLWDGYPAIEEIKSRLPVTLEIGILSLVLGVVIAIPVGVYSAVRQDSIADYIARSSAVVFLSVPHFVIATLAIILPAYYLGWVPKLGYVSFFEDPLEHIILMAFPIIILGVNSTAYLIRMTRAMMLEVLRQDYIRTAWSKGLRERQVVYRHALKNALIPVLTIVGFRVPSAFNGSVIMEVIFGLPGLGIWILDSITLRDYPQLQLAILFMAVIVVITNLVVDLTYGLVDPRVRARYAQG